MARSKKEIDKELMYKKLMPTSQVQDNADEMTTASPVPVAAPEFFAAPENRPNTGSIIATSPTAVISKPETVKSEEPTAANAIVSGKLIEPSGEIVNIMEELVLSRLDAAIDKFRCCTCDKCRKDIMAITLNKLAPNYILSTDDTKRQETELKYAGQAATALVQAILTVKSHPTHE